jgi:glycosyltransferase involved in cell wall biosynthesis
MPLLMLGMTKTKAEPRHLDLLNAEGGCAPSSRRVLVLAEEDTVTGPAKNLFAFHAVCQERKSAAQVALHIATIEPPRTPAEVAARSNQFTERAAELGITVHPISERFRFDPGVIAQLRKLVASVRPDVIETHHVKSHFLVRLSRLWKETPWLAFHHGYTNEDFRSPIYNRLDRWSLRAAARIVTMNRSFERQLVRSGIRGERITVLHNAVRPTSDGPVPVDAATRERRRADLGIAPDERIILCVGRLSKEKGQMDLVAAIDRLRQMRPAEPVRLILAGDGPARPQIVEAIQSMGLSGQVTLAGHIPDIGRYYQAAELVVIPSLSEGSPNVLLEAMAAGIPVVATPVGGIPEIVTHGESALLVPPQDPGAMAEAINLLLSSPSTAISLAQQARAKVEADYTPEGRAGSLIEIYAGLRRSS